MMKRKHLLWVTGVVLFILVAILFSKTGQKGSSPRNQSVVASTQNGVVTFGLQAPRSSNWSVVANFPGGYTNSAATTAPNAPASR